MTGRFEAHITAPKEYARIVEQTGTTILPISSAAPSWVFSQISGCPLLGQGTYCYLTAYDTDDKTMFRRLQVMVAKLEQQGVPILRTKIERIVFDSRTGINEVEIDV